LAHFGFSTDGTVLPDAALPAILTADWQADETNAGKPFPSYARMLQQHGKPEGDSRYSWTIDFTARRARAREAMQPLQEEAAQIKGVVVDLKEKLKRIKKDMATDAQVMALTSEILEKDKAARDLETQATDIEAAVFDLKAVNPTAVVELDNRTPVEIIRNIEEQGRIVANALNKLSLLMSQAD
jgi:type I restriction enzyme M protein